MTFVYHTTEKAVLQTESSTFILALFYIIVLDMFLLPVCAIMWKTQGGMHYATEKNDHKKARNDSCAGSAGSRYFRHPHRTD